MVAVSEERVAGEGRPWGWLCRQRSSLLRPLSAGSGVCRFSSRDQIGRQDALGQAGFACCRGVRQLFVCVRGKVAPYIQPGPRVAESSCPFQNDFSFEIILLHGIAVKINLSLALRCRSGRNFPSDQPAQQERNASFIPIWF